MSYNITLVMKSVPYLSHFCPYWSNTLHPLFHVANLFLLLSYFACGSGYGILYIRSCLLMSSIFFSLWAGIIVCAPDILIWSVCLTLICLIHIIVIICKLHPLIRFPHDVEMVYRDLFKPIQVSRLDFKKIYACTREVQTLKPRDIYAVEGRTPVDKLSLLLSGRVAVIRGGHQLHIIDSHQFLDSPEWFGVCSTDAYQVSIVALEESRLLVWHRDKLKLSICNEPYLQAVLDNVLGRDVVKKLLLVTDVETLGNKSLMANEQSSLIMPSNRAIDVLIKRNAANSLSNDGTCFWNLSRFHESDTETCV